MIIWKLIYFIINEGGGKVLSVVVISVVVSIVFVEFVFVVIGGYFV